MLSGSNRRALAPERSPVDTEAGKSTSSLQCTVGRTPARNYCTAKIETGSSQRHAPTMTVRCTHRWDETNKKHFRMTPAENNECKACSACGTHSHHSLLGETTRRIGLLYVQINANLPLHEQLGWSVYEVGTYVILTAVVLILDMNCFLLLLLRSSTTHSYDLWHRWVTQPTASTHCTCRFPRCFLGLGISESLGFLSCRAVDTPLGGKSRG